ncbi:hypothetical protein L195_g061835 [Trifolium pratense]|uniref:Uncharacterized protein n=1 Tax=Trifolium pratense TaxID=57577 RepID=A0A2K3KC65_TRIPR|nr:hypothetical protein L195_g061835 [Trifolium pratense]
MAKLIAAAFVLLIIITLTAGSYASGETGDQKTILECIIWRTDCLQYGYHCDLYVRFCTVVANGAVPPGLSV